MRVEWAKDKFTVLNTIKHPAVYPFVSDDTCPSVDEFDIPELSDNFFCALCFDGLLYMGCFCFVKKSDVEAEIHTCLLPQARGFSRIFGNAIIRLLFSTTSYSTISTFIPENNKFAKKLAIKCGFSYDSEGKPIIIGSNFLPTQKYILKRGDVCL